MHNYARTLTPAHTQPYPPPVLPKCPARVSELTSGWLSFWSSLRALPLLAWCQLLPYAQAAASEERFEGSQKQPTPQEHAPARCLPAMS